MSDFFDLDELLSRVKASQKIFSTFSQEKVDKIFQQVAIAANEARLELAQLAVSETGIGVVTDKVIKNHFASEEVYTKYINLKTCGVIEEDLYSGYQKVAESVGIVAGITPITNPTSTAIFKTLIALKTRNAIVFCPHPKASKCTIKTLEILKNAAMKAGAPSDVIAWIPNPDLSLSSDLMSHPDINLVLATGGTGMVRSAYSSGNPSLGVGAGDTPVIIDDMCSIESAVSSIILSKTFDNGVICASEQVVIVLESVFEQVKEEFLRRGAYFLNQDEKARLSNVLFKENGFLNPDSVGKTVKYLSHKADIQVPYETRILIADIQEIGENESFSKEKLSPVLGFLKAHDFNQALEFAKDLVEFGGRGHTAVLYTDQYQIDRINKFVDSVKVGRALINTPASQGAIGDLYNFRLEPSLTLGCGSWGGNSFSGNVGPMNLLNIKTVAIRQENTLWYRVPEKIYFKQDALSVGLGELHGKRRVFIITDKPLFDLGLVSNVTKKLDKMGLVHKVFYDVTPDPDLETIYKGLDQINSFNPDVIIAFGGGSPMDAAKIIWLLYERPEITFEGISMRFMDIRKRIYALPKLGEKAILIAIPTTSGTGSEVTPFAVVTDESTGIKYPIADYSLTPNMAIIDPNLVMDIPKSLTAFGGIDALTHALESYASICATEFTNPQALEAIRLLFKYLPDAYLLGRKAPKARTKVHYAATIAGTAFANAFLGICHSMAHKLGSAYHIPHGLANALMISYVVRYNATDKPFKQGIFSQYKYPRMKVVYSNIIDFLNLGCDLEESEKVDLLIQKVEQLKRDVGIPKSIREVLGDKVSEQEYLSKVEKLALEAFDDQCTGTNPRSPLICELKQLLIDAYYGNTSFESDQAMSDSMQRAKSEIKN